MDFGGNMKVESDQPPSKYVARLLDEQCKEIKRYELSGFYGYANGVMCQLSDGQEVFIFPGAHTLVIEAITTKK